ncbi:MAG: TonB-dependent receptor [Candidatus Acidiferrales bacterium]
MSHSRWSLCLAMVGVLLAPAYAQLPTASLRGTVTDASGSSIPLVRIKILNTATGIIERSLATDTNGNYSAEGLPPATYKVSLEKDGFATRTLSVELQVGRIVELNAELTVQAAQQTVTVSAGTPVVDAESSVIGGVIDRNSVESLPLNGRQFADLATLVPGVLPAPNFDPIKTRVLNISAGGSDGRSSNFSVDGGDDTDNVNGGLLQNFTVEGIQEFHVSSSRFSADQGRALGAAINVVTKSGSNKFHGGYFIFYRNQDLNARDPLQTIKPNFHRTQQGFTLGGPVKKDRTFFFVAFENTDELNLGIVDTNGVFPQFEGSFPLPFTSRLLTVRGDHQINSKQSLTVRYALDDNFSLQGIGGIRAADNGIHSANRGSSFVATHTYTISPRVVNNFTYHFEHFYNALLPLSQTPEVDRPSLITGGAFNAPQTTLIIQNQARDDMAMTIPGAHGEHNLKWGVDYQRVKVNASLSYAGRGQFSFFTDAPLSATSADLAFLSVGNFNFPTYNDNILGAYFVDDWKVTKRLNLNLGLRWDVSTNENNPNFVSPISPAGSRSRDLNNWGPRIGFTADLLGTGKTIVRGGYGIFYAAPVSTDPAVESAFDGRRIGFGLFLGPIDVNNPFPGLSPAQIQALVFAQPQFLLLTLANHVRTSYVQEESIGFQQELTRTLGLTVDYVHNLGVKERIARDVNIDSQGQIGTAGTILAQQFTPALAATYGPVIRVDDSGMSKYNALEVTANKHFGQGFQFLASYTLSHGVDMGDDSIGSTVANPFNLQPEWGDSNRDQRHRFVFSGLVHLPWGFELSTITSFASARPFDIITGQSPDGFAPQRPAGVTRNKGARDDPATIAAINAARLQAGLLPITTTSPRSFFFYSTDLRLQKTFVIRDKFSIVGGVEGFNIFNHPNFLSNGGPTFSGVSGAQTNALTPDFGFPRRTAGGVLGSGGPRAEQLMLRVQF